MTYMFILKCALKLVEEIILTLKCFLIVFILFYKYSFKKTPEENYIFHALKKG